MCGDRIFREFAIPTLVESRFFGYSLGWFYVDTRLGGSLFLVQSRLFCCLDFGAMSMDVVPSQLSKLDTCMSYKLVFSLIYVYSFYL